VDLRRGEVSGRGEVPGVGTSGERVTPRHRRAPKTQRRRLQEDPSEYRTPHEVSVTASRKMPHGFCRYKVRIKVRIPYSSQTFTVLPTKYVGATFIIAPGTSLRSLANVTLKAQQNMQFCKERIRRRRGLGGCCRIPYPPANFYRTAHEGLPYPPRIFTVPLTKDYRTPREFLPYRSVSVLRRYPANRAQMSWVSGSPCM
jgi:hypothetical protein